MSRSKKKIENLMKETGSCWAYRSDKHESNLSNGQKKWHVHPDSENPYQDHVKMFSTLAGVWEFLQDLWATQDRDRLFRGVKEK